jgi:UDP:flavonoid glycosyltransferase YjiC (YdhE family)
MAPHVVFVALGSRGDVQPLAVLATQLAKNSKKARVSLVSALAQRGKNGVTS